MLRKNENIELQINELYEAATSSMDTLLNKAKNDRTVISNENIAKFVNNLYGQLDTIAFEVNKLRRYVAALASQPDQEGKITVAWRGNRGTALKFDSDQQLEQYIFNKYCLLNKEYALISNALEDNRIFKETNTHSGKSSSESKDSWADWDYDGINENKAEKAATEKAAAEKAIDEKLRVDYPHSFMGDVNYRKFIKHEANRKIKTVRPLLADIFTQPPVDARRVSKSGLQQKNNTIVTNEKMRSSFPLMNKKKSTPLPKLVKKM